jgi:hypothetical protein
MGLINPQEAQSALDESLVTQGVPMPMEPAPTAPEQSLGLQDQAALQARTAEQVSWPVSLLHNGLGNWEKEDPNYPTWDKIKDTQYAHYPDYFINVGSDRAFDEATKKVDEKLQYEDLASRAPTTALISSIAWGAADPLWLIPGISSIKAAKIAGVVSKARTAAVTGIKTAGAIAAGEGILQAGQPDRTAEQSAINIAAGALVGSVLGAYAGHIAKETPAIAGEFKVPGVEPSIPSTPINPAHEAALMTEAEKLFAMADDTIPRPTTHTWPQDDHVSIVSELKKQEDISDLADNELELLGIKDREAAIKAQQESADLADPVLEKELADALAPKGGDLKNLEEDTGVGAGYVTYDQRVAGLPDWVLKTYGNSRVMPANIEALASPSPIVRDLATRGWYQHLPFESTMDDSGKALPLPLESKITEDMKTGIEFNKEFQSLYLKSQDIDPASVGSGLKGAVRMKSRDFESEVLKAMHQGDTHENQYVQAAARLARKHIGDRIKLMQEAGLEPAYLKDWGFSHVWDINRIIADRGALEKALAGDFVNHQKAKIIYTDKLGKEKTDSALVNLKTKEHDWIPKDGEKFKSVILEEPLTIAEARTKARDTVDDILKLGDKNLALGDIDRLTFMKNTDNFKPRSIMTAYDIIRPWLVQDFRQLFHNYMSSTSRAARIKEMMNDLGIDNFNDLRIRNRDHFDNLIAKIQNIKEKPQVEINKLPKEERSQWIDKKKKDKMVAKLTKQSKSSLELLDDVLHMQLGQYKKRTSADPFFRMMNQYNAARLLGGVIISALGDPLGALLKNSVPDVIWHGWIGQLKSMALNTEKIKKQDYFEAFTAMQGEMDDAIRYLMNPDATPFSVGPTEKVVNALGQIGQKVTLMQYWNNFWQRVNHRVAESRILRDLEKGFDSLNSREQEFLRGNSIDADMAKRIQAMSEKYGYDVRGSRISNSHMWSDREAALHFNHAIRNEVHISPVITEQGDLPRFFAKSELRRSIYQLKGFPAAAISKITLNAAARHDTRALTGIVALVSAGMVVQLMKDKLAGRESNYTPAQWIIRGIDKSGVAGLLLDPLWQARYAADNTAKYGGRAWVSEPLEYMMGPSSSLVNPAYHAILDRYNALNDKLSGRTPKPMDKKVQQQLKMFLPYQNLFYAPWSSKK